MATHYIYLPVYDLGLVNVARKWKQHNDTRPGKQFQIIVRQSTGLKKALSRQFEGGLLRNVDPTATVYVLAHGYSAGRDVGGDEARARSLLSTYGDNYPYLKKNYPAACAECEEQGYVADKGGYSALEASLDDPADYDAVLKIFSKHKIRGGDVTVEISRPGALRIGGTRPGGATKVYTAAEFAAHLRREALPQIPKLKIFACNSAVAGRNSTTSFAEDLYNLLSPNYPNIRVYGYLGAVTADYGYQKLAADGEIPGNLSEMWKNVHDPSGELSDKHMKGVRIVKPSTRGVLIWGSTYSEFVPAHTLRVEFPGGQSVMGDMIVQEDDSKPF